MTNLRNPRVAGEINQKRSNLMCNLKNNQEVGALQTIMNSKQHNPEVDGVQQRLSNLHNQEQVVGDL